MKNEKVIKEYQEKFEDALVECCMLRLFGVFRMGPMLVKPMGFDVVTYADCIDICMEKCQEPDFEKVRDQEIVKRVVQKQLK